MKVNAEFALALALALAYFIISLEIRSHLTLVIHSYIHLQVVSEGLGRSLAAWYRDWRGGRRRPGGAPCRR